MKLGKRILSVLIAALLLLACVPMVAFAGETDEEIALQAFTPAPGRDTSMYPNVYTSGGWHPLYVGEDWEGWNNFLYSGGSPVEYQAKIDAAKVFDEVAAKGAMNSAIAEFKSLNSDRIANALMGIFTDGFAGAAMDKSGKSINPDITCTYEHLRLLGHTPIKDAGGLAANSVMMMMDWRQDPWELAGDLHTFIEELIAKYGSGTHPDYPCTPFDKVNLSCVSGSGPVLLCYLARFGTDHLVSAVFNMSLHAGSSLYGGLALGQFGLDGGAMATGNMMFWGALRERLSQYSGVMNALYQIGLLDVLTKGVNLVFSSAFNKLYEEGIKPYWFQMPFYLCIIPLHQYEQAKKTLFKGNPDYDALVDIADRYHGIMAMQDSLIRKAASEIKVGVRCGYGSSLSPYALGTQVMSDEMVDTVNTSLGATCATPGIPFSPLYKQKVCSEKNYISPDRLVDASTCLLPDSTWFAKDFYHFPEWRYQNPDNESWYDWFLSAEDYTVWSDDRYPQYLQWVRPEGTAKSYYETIDVYKPMEPAAPTIWQNIGDTLKTAGLWIMHGWRWTVLLPLFWTKYI